jgi:hypothetical protein
MPMDWQVFDKAQDDDLVAALARRQADEEGRLAIVRAMEQQQAQRANQELSREQAATQREYRQASIEERRAATEQREQAALDASEKSRVEAEQLKERRERLTKLAATSTDPRVRQAAEMELAGMKMEPFKIGGGMKKVYSLDRQTMKPVLTGEIEDDAEMRVEPAPQRLQVTMPGTGLTPNQYRAAIRDLHTQYTTDTANERVIMGKYGLMQTAWNEFSKNPSFRDPAGQTLLVTFQKVLDPESVVRESEYARSVEGQALTRQLAGWWQKLTTGGPAVSNADLQAYMNTMRAWAAEAQKYHDAKKSRIKLAADDLEIPMDRIVAEVPGQTSVVDPNAAKTDALGAAAGAVRDAAAPPARKNPLGLPPPRGRK